MSDVAVPIVPREVLFGNPERTSPRIAPDGGVLNVWVGTVGGAESRPVTRDRDRGIRSFSWAHDRRHLLFLQDKGGDENWRLHDVDLETDEIRDLTPFEDVQARVEELDKRFPDHVLVGLNRDNPELHDVYRLDLRSGELEKIAENPGFVALLADAGWEVRAGLAPTADGGLRLMVRDDADAEWRQLVEVGQEDAIATEPVDFTLDGTA